MTDLSDAAEWLGVPVDDLGQAPPSVIESLTRRRADELHAAAVHAEILERLGDLRTAAITDQLTRLPNRRLFEERLVEALQEAERTGSNIAVFLADVDHFKAINDRLGHLAGDQLLRAVAERLKASIRRSDLIGRWGGDEFVIACKKVDAQAAERIARTAEENVARDPFAIGGSIVQTTVTVGWSTVVGGTVEASIKAADAAMYERKRSANRRSGLADLRGRAGVNESARRSHQGT